MSFGRTLTLFDLTQRSARQAIGRNSGRADLIVCIVGIGGALR
jgi:hypothetical protein